MVRLLNTSLMVRSTTVDTAPSTIMVEQFDKVYQVYFHKHHPHHEELYTVHHTGSTTAISHDKKKVIKTRNRRIRSISLMHRGTYVVNVHLQYNITCDHQQRHFHKAFSTASIVSFITMTDCHVNNKTVIQSMHYNKCDILTNHITHKFIMEVDSPTELNFFIYKNLNAALLSFENVSVGGFVEIDLI